VPTERPSAQPRGAARRRALLEAAVQVIGRGGIASVGHRAVATEAGVPLGSTTYYFESKEDMVAQALRYVAEREAERLHAAAERMAADKGGGFRPDRLADLLLDVWAGDRVVLMAQYELYLEAGRRDDLQPSVESWDRAYRELLERGLRQLGAPDPARRARLLCAGLDGLLLEHVATGSDAAELRALAVELIASVAAPRA
jgi:TetR/AcrR family transcriptional regulator, regulator of biofilm formation and stress response